MIKKRKNHDNKLVAGLQIRNEAHRYLTEVLTHLNQWVDEIVIIDDNSTDNSREICLSFSKVSRVVELKKNTFEYEYDLRKTLWNEVKKSDPDWILIIDADEIFEDKIITQVRSLINQTEFDWVAFRLYDFWGCRTHYRSDEYWKAHTHFDPILIRYIEGLPEFWKEQPVHTGRYPIPYFTALNGIKSPIRIKHYGWAGDEEDRLRKFHRYMSSDPQGIYGNLNHYHSILDQNPHLEKWED